MTDVTDRPPAVVEGIPNIATATDHRAEHILCGIRKKPAAPISPAAFIFRHNRRRTWAGTAWSRG